MKSVKSPLSVLFVCLGNICRSPTAEAVFRQIIVNRMNEGSLLRDMSIDSAGTGAWHIGSQPDSRAIAAGRTRGYDLSSLRARQVSNQDFSQFDFILAMDNDNLRNLRNLSSLNNFRGHLGLFLDFSPSSETEVPDPYYGGSEGFDHVLDLIESASHGFIDYLIKTCD
ncbi:low molecular weight protein-tyrosine-phosphatase [Sessilibacter sp. MAH2]